MGGGDGTGYVEAEFQLYPYLTALLMHVIGPEEWIGQWLSLFCIGFAAVVLYRLFEKRYAAWVAMLGAVCFLSLRAPMFASSSVQPDGMSVLLFCMALYFFLDYFDEQSTRSIILSTLCLTFASLVKPAALQLGLFQFFLVCWARPALLRDPRLWLSWITVVGCVAFYMGYAYQLFVDYGNTFGVIGGESKFPTIEAITTPWRVREFIEAIIFWGMGVLGCLAAAVLVVTRGLDKATLLLGAANIVWLLLSFRYSANIHIGAHYHLFGSVFSAWVVVRCLGHLQSKGWMPTKKIWGVAVPGVLCTLLVGHYLYELKYRQGLHEDSSDVAFFELGHALAQLTDASDLVIVRSIADGEVPVYRTINNFEDPRLLYIAGVKGWIVPKDEERLDAITDYHIRGAAYYVDYDDSDFPALDSWLANHGAPVWKGEGGRIIKLRSVD